MNINNLSFAKKPIMAIALSTLIVVSQSASAVGHEKQYRGMSAGENMSQSERESKRNEHMKRRMKKLAKYLELSKEQRLALRAVMTEKKSNRTAESKSIKSYREEVRALSLTDDFDEVQFQLIYEKYQDNFEQRALDKAKTRHAIMQILTQEQREKFMQMKEKKKRSRLF